jgi:hypothetical protein
LPSHLFTCGISRSGTTLLTTILDSHPQVSMGYELMPLNMPAPDVAAEAILATGSGDRDECTAALREQGLESLAVLVHRAHRTLVSPGELAEILQRFADAGETDLNTLENRVALSAAIVEAKQAKEGTAIWGFKCPIPRVGRFDNALGRTDTAYVFIVRDPRDAWSSHRERGFDMTVEQMARQWVEYLTAFETFAKRNPGRGHLLRYEDLVNDPRRTIDEMCAALGLSRDPAMDAFYQGKASVLQGGHANSDKLSQDFFTSSVDRWRNDVPQADVRTLESICFEGMERHGYERSTDVGFRFPRKQWTDRQTRMDERRTYFVDEYASIVLPAIEAMPHRTWLEATSAPEPLEELLVIRHDIDNDIETAVKLARWEAEHGIRATYCVLHTAWYYGRFEAGRLRYRSEDMVEACLEIQALGHEINLHNNAVTVGLRTGVDPYDVVAEELDYLRGRGLDIKGTSTHGDNLCHKVGYRNLELFSETAPDGARTLEHEGTTVTIGTRSMAELGLTYEGYDLPRDVYISDSGGKLKVVADTPGRAGRSRAELGESVPYRHVVGILTHPCWWDLDDPKPRRREDVSYRVLLRRLNGEEPSRFSSLRRVFGRGR